MNDIFEQMRKDFDVFMARADKLIEKYKKEDKEEKPVKDVGKLCYFWNFGVEGRDIGVLFAIEKKGFGYQYFSDKCRCYDCYSRLTPQEVAEITGYKVVDLG